MEDKIVVRLEELEGIGSIYVIKPAEDQVKQYQQYQNRSVDRACESFERWLAREDLERKLNG